MKRARVALTALALLLPVDAQAQPGMWQRARQPGAVQRAHARLRAEQLFEAATGARSDVEVFRDLSLGSAASLELGGGARSDPWQSVLLGRVLLDAQAGREQEAMQLIQRGLAQLPASDFKRESYFDLGLGALISSDFSLAERAFTAALSLAWDSDYRASIHRNRGKVRMLVGDLTRAVSDFRAAVRLARGTEVVALSHFGLGVALDRSGDFPQGLMEVARGVAIRLPVPPYPSESVLDLPNLRWVPEYDVHYFRALSFMAEATVADTPELQETGYLMALSQWDEYLPAAEARKDRFVANAHRHRRRCAAAIDGLSSRLAPRKKPGSSSIR